jgi:hypothetical protein
MQCHYTREGNGLLVSQCNAIESMIITVVRKIRTVALVEKSHIRKIARSFRSTK